MNDSSFKANLSELLLKWQEPVEAAIEEIKRRFGPADSTLAEACRYALSGDAKRFRPTIVFMMGGEGAAVQEAAMAVELFHTASLVADDLPCMDNDDLRRNRPSLHRAFDEATALLASYALIAEGYACLARCGGSERLQLALENAAANTGAKGATGGQHLDICPPNHNLDTILEVLEKKTVTLFEVAFVFGWLFGGGAIEKLPNVKRAAHHFGMAFQIADDLSDLKADSERHAVNLGLLLGVEGAKKRLEEASCGFMQELKALELEKSELAQLIELLKGV